MYRATVPVFSIKGYYAGTNLLHAGTPRCPYVATCAAFASLGPFFAAVYTCLCTRAPGGAALARA